MADAQLRQFLDKVRQLNAFVAMSEADPRLRQELSDCEHHDQVVALARRCGFEIGRRWGEQAPSPPVSDAAQAWAPPAAGDSTAPGSNSSTSGPDGGVTPLRSLLASPCPPPGEEISELVMQTPLWRLERIHSCAARSPEGFWYEQREEEWVLLLQGSAALRFADQPEDLSLRAGDSLWIRAGRRHRVTATDPEPGTIWLALFWRSV